MIQLNFDEEEEDDHDENEDPIDNKNIAVKKFSDKHKFIPNTHFFPRRSLLKIRLQWR